MAVKYEVGESYYSRLLEEYFYIEGIRESWYSGDYEYIVTIYSKDGKPIHKSYYTDEELEVILRVKW